MTGTRKLAAVAALVAAIVALGIGQAALEAATQGKAAQAPLFGLNAASLSQFRKLIFPSFGFR